MGWDSGNEKSITEVKAYIRNVVARSGYTILAEAGSSEFWYVVEKEGVRRLFLTLIEKHGEYYAKKDMTEDEYPYYFNCPDKLIALVGEPKTEDAKRWREHRASVQARKKIQWKPGDEFLLFGTNGAKHTIVDTHGKGFVFVDKGQRYKVKREQMFQVPAEEAK